ncbi:MAG: hypothetical protein M1839_009380 [Geoglossum umbratile]|nr:MAG: hypothetical protein M1839_009380 [Geoglossum umbratile]
MSNETNPRKRKREHLEYGLMEIGLSNGETSGRDLSNGVDVIFIHGLGSHRTKAWSTTAPQASSSSAEADQIPCQPNDIIWVRDFLAADLKPELCERTRLFLYGYNSSWMFDAPAVNVHSLAQNLLDTIETGRRQEKCTKSRRIIFVAHSHGGLLAKEALVIDASPRGSNSIASHTDAILFFGTPHQGSNLASFGQVVSKVLSIWGSNANILESLKPGHESLWDLHERFTAVLEQRLAPASKGPIRVINFYEELKTTIIAAGASIKLSRIVVDKQSATFQFPYCKNLPLQRDHKLLSKFEQRDTDYQKILATLTTCMEESIKVNQMGGPMQMSYPEDTKIACLQSLSFRNIDSRRHDIASAHQNTCGWLFATAQFQQWQSRDDLDSNNGVLWIKGKPGAGKSTLMKHALLHYQESFPSHAIAAYFFNARGDAFEKSPLGMLRSLLYQLLEQDPQSCNRFIPLFLDKRKKHGDNWMWYSGELKDFLLEIVRHPTQPILLFVDALDECDESEVRDVVSFLERLSLAAIVSETSLNICLSSRHYPTISMRRMLELVVEKRKEHDRDIAIYVQDKLKIRDKHIESELLRKAGGVFMWIVLVTEMLNQAFDEGRIIAMRKKLDDVPGDLDEVFRTLLEREYPHRHETVLALQWVLFAERPLSPEELYFAVLAGTEPEDLGPWDRSKVTDQAIKRFITTTSRGLIEVRKGDRGIVQFIHESVNDFLVRSKRLQTLDLSLCPHVIGASHDRLVGCCLSYLEMVAIEPLEEDMALWRELPWNYPFLNYVSVHILYHAERASVGCVTQHAHLQRLQHVPKVFERLKRFHDDFQHSEEMKYGMETELLYVTSLCLYQGLTRSILLEPSVDVNAPGGCYGNALQAATANSRFSSAAATKEVVQMLLDAGADVNAQGGCLGNALQAAASAASAASYGGFGSITTTKEVIQTLLDAGADINAQGGHYGNALQAATAADEIVADNRLDTTTAIKKVVQMLLDAGADVNAQGGYYGNALQAAVFTVGIATSSGDTFHRAAIPAREITQMLLDAGADANAQGGHYGSALQAAAAVSAAKGVAQMLLDAGADVNAQCGHYGNALQAAAAAAAKEIVQMLLDAGADVNAQGGYYGSALQAAAAAATVARSRFDSAAAREVVQMLLNAGADVNAQSGHYGNALQAAADAVFCRPGRNTREVVQMLLDAGADISAQSGHYGNALQAAAAKAAAAATIAGSIFDFTTAREVVQMLLDAGADINAQGGHYGNALQAATAAVFHRSGRNTAKWQRAAAKEIVQMLLDAGADVNAQGGHYGNALQAAAAAAATDRRYDSNTATKEVIQVLLDAGADINAQGGYYDNALQAATSTHASSTTAVGNAEEIIQMLLDAGAVRGQPSPRPNPLRTTHTPA